MLDVCDDGGWVVLRASSSRGSSCSVLATVKADDVQLCRGDIREASDVERAKDASRESREDKREVKRCERRLARRRRRRLLVENLATIEEHSLPLLLLLCFF